MNLKKLLKTIKLNESSISMVLGILVIVIVGSLVIRYLKADRGTIPQELLNQPNSIESTVKTHKIQKGESLWVIAENYYGDGFKWVDIATENKIANASIIEVDQELVIPNLDQEEVQAEEMASESASTEAPTEAQQYTVEKGDSLWKIAVKVYGDGYKWVEIAKENKITTPNIIYSGNILVLPR
jgi:nucleoid-associated protein YgaU